MNRWQENARHIVLEYAACRSTSERIQLVEHLADASTDLATWEEILRLAMIGTVALGRELEKK